MRIARVRVVGASCPRCGERKEFQPEIGWAVRGIDASKAGFVTEAETLRRRICCVPCKLDGFDNQLVLATEPAE